MPPLRLAQLGALGTTLAITLPTPTRQQRLANTEDRSPGPLRIGFHRDLPTQYRSDLTARLRWVNDPVDASVTAAVTITSPTALGMRMAIRAHLPRGGTIRFFRGGEVVGVWEEERGVATSDLDNQPLRWSPSVDGDSIGLEITLPSREAVAESILEIDRVAHRFQGAQGTTLEPRAPRPSSQLEQECPHIEIACRDVEPMASAVALIGFETTAGSMACTGTLMNDTDTHSRIPYFLTAHHCVSTQPVADSLEAYWFHQFTSCDGGILDQRRVRTADGADFLTTSEAQDSTLLRLRGQIPRGAWLAGWNSGLVRDGRSVYGIHHPRGQEKQYVAGTARGGLDFDICDEDDTDCISLVNGIPVDLEEGTLGPGSSGSGLFDGEQLVGALSGADTCVIGAYGRFGDFFPQARRWLDPGTAQGGRVTVRPTTLEVPEGTSRSYEVRLNIAPRERVTVSITRTGDQDLTPQHTSIHFTPQDWGAWQIDVSAREDADTVDGTATLSHEVRTDDPAYQGIRIASVNVYERDNDAPPPKVTGVSARPSEEPGALRISWDEVPGADAYIVEWRQRSQGFAAHRRRVVRGATHTVLSDLHGSYLVRVTATRNGLRGQPSDAVAFVAEGRLHRFLRGWRLELLRRAAGTPASLLH